MDSQERHIQVGGALHLWRNPGNTFKHHFLELDLNCEPSPYPGILIIADDHNNNAESFNVESLIKKLPSLLRDKSKNIRAYWTREDDANERSLMHSKLTPHPLYLG